MPSLKLCLVVSTCLITAMAGVRLSAQASPSAAGTLPDAPSQVKARSGMQGNIIDTNGNAVPNANVTLVGPKGDNEKLIQSATDGTFSFADLTPQVVRLTVTAAGMETYVSPEMRLNPGDTLKVEEIILPIAPANEQISVVATQEQVAEEQLNAALHQRALGVLPNFYTSYIWDAAPLNFRQKTKLAFRSTTDPAEFIVVGIVAGVGQARNSFKDYGQGARGYAERFGAAYGDVVISRFFGAVVYPSIFHQDPRYFYRGSGSVPRRFLYAISTSVIQKSTGGHFQPAYSRILGSATAGVISFGYKPGRDRGPGLVFENIGIGIGGHAATALVREFVLRKVTKGIPTYEQGKPTAEHATK